MSKDIERAAFEAWALGVGYPKGRLTHSKGVSYVDDFVDHLWDGWQARAALAQEAQAVPAELSKAQRIAIEAALSISAEIEGGTHDGSFLSNESVQALNELLSAPQSVPAQPVANERKYTQSEMESYGKAYADARDKRRASTDRKVLAMGDEPSVIGGAFEAPPAAEQDAAPTRALTDARDAERYRMARCAPYLFGIANASADEFDALVDAAILTAAGAK